MTSLKYYCIPGLAETKTYAQKMQDAQVTKSLPVVYIALIRAFSDDKSLFIISDFAVLTSANRKIKKN